MSNRKGSVKRLCGYLLKQMEGMQDELVDLKCPAKTLRNMVLDALDEIEDQDASRLIAIKELTK